MDVNALLSLVIYLFPKLTIRDAYANHLSFLLPPLSGNSLVSLFYHFDLKRLIKKIRGASYHDMVIYYPSQVMLGYLKAKGKFVLVSSMPLIREPLSFNLDRMRLDLTPLWLQILPISTHL